MRKIIRKLYLVLTVAICFCTALSTSVFHAFAQDSYREESLSKIKNVILLIGDGMGQNQVKAGEIYKGEKLVLQSLPHTTYALTRSANNSVTDSAAAATALATGVRTNNNMVGLDPTGKELTTIMDIALAHGKRTGVITTEELYGATPMGFSAHNVSRSASAELLESAAKSGINLFASAGGATSSFTANGYTKVENVADISEAASDYVIGTYNIKASAASQSAESTSVAFDRVVSEAIEFLSKDQDGFVLMAEGAKIDKAGHANNFTSMLEELMAFDDGVKAALDWAKNRNDTVVIVTADHETGGLILSENITVENMLNPGSYEWTTTGHSGANVYCNMYGSDVGFTRFSSYKTGEQINNTDIFQIMQAFVTGRQKSNVHVKKSFTAYGEVTLDKAEYYFGEKAVITVMPDQNYEISSVKVNGKECISQVKNNTLEYIVDAADVEISIRSKSTICYVSYQDLGDKGEFGEKVASLQKGETLVVQVTAANGYEVEEVTFLGEKMTKREDGKYEIVVQDSGRVEVAFKQVENTQNNQQNNNPSGSGGTALGCAGSIGGTAVVASLGLALAVALKKKR